MPVAIRALLASLILLVTSTAVAQPWKTDIDWVKLSSEVGGSLENGAGIGVGMTEAPINANFDFMPDVNWIEFVGKTITNGSNANNNPSGHATVMAQTFFGNSVSIAPGVTNITVYEANDWVDNRLGFTSGADPIAQPFRVHNNSWIGTGTTAAETTNYSQRLDFAARQNQMTVVAGTNNGGGNPLPELLSHTYNSIIVGLTNGNHAAGSTSTYGNPRRRPDIVAPIGSTSEATAIVSSTAALLHQKAGAGLAGRIDTMRSIILAGATKEEFPGWSRTSAQPMDATFGAGEVNVYNSYRIIEGGQQNGSTSQPGFTVGFRGWDYRPTITAGTQAGGPVYYDFDVGNGFQLKDLSIILSWDMQITDTNASAAIFTASELLGDLNLDFFNSTGLFLGSLLDSSLATGGNVEHLWFQSLNAGRYTLRVTSNTTRDYAIAWRSSLVAIPEPGSAALLGCVAVLVLIRRRR